MTPLPFGTANRPVLLIGAFGMLARAWAELLTRKQLAFEAVDLPDFDLTRPASVEAALGARHSLVINCAAYTDVDGAEANEPLATAINATGVAALANRCRETDTPLIHYSTDYVFDGTKSGPYLTTDQTVPINAYGRSKLGGEEAVVDLGYLGTVIRTSWLYAPWAGNFVRTMVRLTAERDELTVVDDQRGRPTSAIHLAAASLALFEREASGIWHVTDGGACSWYEFAVAIANATGADCNIRPCSTADYPRPAARPANSVLDLSATETLIGPMPDWRTNLAETLDHLE